jgi:glycosyltransferase involved in cell wall biosynthesis
VKSDYLLFIGRLSAEKAPHLAIEAALANDRRIVLAGKISTPDEQAYFDSSVLPLLDHPLVTYVGEADGAKKRQLFAGASAFLMPLLWEEPFGLVMIEAMACGTPAIAFNRGGAPELIRHGETGFLVEDADEMAAAIRRIRDLDPASCRAHVEANFSPEVLADRYLEVYESILHPREGGGSDGDLDNALAKSTGGLESTAV